MLLVFCTLLHEGFAQCTVYDGQGNNSANPVWVSCSGGSYTLYIQSPNDFGALTINWGDGSANTTVAALLSPAFISHTYAATIANYSVTITETNGCTITVLVGFQYKDVQFGYSYDLTISKLITDSGGAHEVSLKWEIESERQKRKRRRSKFLIPCAKF